MAISWEIFDIDRNHKNHYITVRFKEILPDGRSFFYSVSLPPESTKMDFATELKKQVTVARSLRARTDAIRAQFDSAELEAFIKS